jgi:hypothetical protein
VSIYSYFNSKFKSLFRIFVGFMFQSIFRCWIAVGKGLLPVLSQQCFLKDWKYSLCVGLELGMFSGFSFFLLCGAPIFGHFLPNKSTERTAASAPPRKPLLLSRLRLWNTQKTIKKLLFFSHFETLIGGGSVKVASSTLVAALHLFFFSLVGKGVVREKLLSLCAGRVFPRSRWSKVAL